MKHGLMLLMAALLFVACKKEEVKQELHIRIKTPFRTGTVEIRQDGGSTQTMNVQGDSLIHWVWYEVSENSQFYATITRNNLDTGVGYVTLNWAFGNKSQDDRLYFDTLVFKMKTTYPYVAQTE